MVRPWSIGTSLFVTTPVLGSTEFWTRILHAFLSKLRRRTSRTAILCTSSAEKRSGEKFSIGPSLLTNNYSDPGFEIYLDSSKNSYDAADVEGLDLVEIIDLGELKGLCYCLDGIFEFLA